LGAVREAARDTDRLAGRAAEADLARTAFGLLVAGAPVAISIAAIIASRTEFAMALIASVMAAAGFAIGSLTVVAGGAAASSLMSHSLSSSAWVGTVPCETRCRRAATESRTIFSTTSSGRRFRSENLMKLLLALTPCNASLCFSTTSFSATYSDICRRPDSRAKSGPSSS
jgi:hypothetical protein